MLSFTFQHGRPVEARHRRTSGYLLAGHVDTRSR